MTDPHASAEPRCQDCGALFDLGPSRRAWFLKKGLVLPNRCPQCRELARLRAHHELPADGLDFWIPRR
jgi:hypothetical protein